MNSLTRSDKAITVRDLCFLSLAAALMFAIKLALSSLPNINLNALIIILVTVFFGWKAMYTVCVYILLEGFFFGFGIWWISYLIVWPLLVALSMMLRKNSSPVLWAILAGLFGLAFGPLMYIIFFTITGGWEGFLPMWIAGIPYDLIHAISNFLSVIVLFRPLSNVITRFVVWKYGKDSTVLKCFRKEEYNAQRDLMFR